MNLNQFQTEAKVFNKVMANDRVQHTVLGLNQEAGEVAGKFKKALRDDDNFITTSRRRDIGYELGDVLWYVADLAGEIGYTLEEIATMNLNKLKDRERRGVLGGSGDGR